MTWGDFNWRSQIFVPISSFLALFFFFFHFSLLFFASCADAVAQHHLNGTVLGLSAPSLTSGLWNSLPGREWMVAQHCSQ